MYIEQPVRSRIKKYGLRAWFDGKKFPKTAYFEHVDALRREYRKLIDEGTDPNWEFMQPTVSRSLSRSGLLGGHLDNKEIDVDDEEEWARIGEAAGWVVLERYEKAVADDDWSPVL